ncbi:MAG: uroporphyrinogen-III synthase [Acetobacteraceae bacterium]|nr:uroporphyrinogen-III synthase [Acetobacteraceae bacterium]
MLTRPEPGASETAARLSMEGFTPIIAPLLTIRPLAARFPPLSQVQGLLVTSSNALTGIPEQYRGLALFAVGDATAARAERLGFSRVMSANGDARALAQLTAERCQRSGSALLLASGSGQGGQLAQELRALGFRVLRRVTYVARPATSLARQARTALAAGAVQWALFFSAETAATFVRLVRAASLDRSLGGIDAVAIGQAAAVALEALPWRSIRIALRPTMEEMMALLP